jgi:hypothetical protein
MRAGRRDAGDSHPSSPSPSLRRFLVRLAPVFLLAAGVTLFHWRGLQPGYTFLPVDLARTVLPWGDGSPRILQNWLISDPLYQFYPFLVQAVDSIRQGQWLFWNPAILLGHPAAADPLFQTFYPGVLPFALLFGPARGYAIALYAHALLAAMLMYGFMRSLRISPPGAVVAGFTYALSGYLLTWFEFSFWLTTLAWLPGILWAYVWAVRTRSWAYVALGGLCLGLALLAGQFQFVVVFLVFFFAGASAYTILAQWTDAGAGIRGCQPAKEAKYGGWWPLLAALAVALTGGMIGAVQAVMLADFLPLTTRTVGNGGTGLPFSQLLTLLLPNFYGNPSRSDYWGAGNFNETTVYVGIVALFLALLAIIRFRRLPPDALIAAVATICLLYLMLGGPGTGLLQALPLLSQVPLSRFAFLLPLMIGWLAAVIVDDMGLSGRAVLVPAALLVILGGLLAAVFWNDGIAGNVHLLQEDVATALLLIAATVTALLVRIRLPHYRQAANWALAGLVFANLAWFGRTYNPVGPVDDLFPAESTVQFLQEQAGDGRIVALQRGPLLFGPNVLGMLGLQEPSGYSSLVVDRYHDLLAAADPELDSKLANRASNHLLFSYPPQRLLDMLAVGRMVASEEIFDPGPAAEFVRSDCTAATAPITAGSPLAGTFDVWRTAINRIDLLFAPPPAAGSEGALVFRVWRGAEGDDLFVETRLPTADLANSPQQTIYFAAQPDAPGQIYRWRLDSEGADAASLRLCADATGTSSLSLYGTQLQEVHAEDGVRIYDRFTAYPRAAVVYAAETLSDDAAAIDRILDPAFDLRNTAVSSEATSLPALAPAPAHAAQIVAEDNQRIVVRATAAAPAMLVLADQHYPGWEARVDGIVTPIVRVNSILRGVLLAPGEHEVVFEFRPPALWAGAALSCIGLLFAAALLVFSLRR